MHDKANYYHLYRKYIRAQSLSQIFSDEDPGNILGEELESREKLYTSLLSDYTKITKARNILKEIHKWVFFWIIIGAGIIVTYFSCNVLSRILSFDDNNQFLQALPLVITSLVSLLSAIIGVPITVTRFLFNSKEDDNITNTIHHTQDHDFEEINLLQERYTGKNKNNSLESTQTMSDDD